MNEEDLSTVSDEWEDITIESDEGSISFGDGSIYTIDNPLPVQVVDPSDSAPDLTEEEYSKVEDATEGASVRLQNVLRDNSGSSRSVVSEFRNVWKLSIASTEYNILFPEGATLSVVDGKLYNIGTSSITGIVLDDSFSDSSYFHRTFTILPLTSTSTQNTVYRYGSRQYFTDYSNYSGTSLQTTVSYVQSSVVHRPYGWDLSPADWIICGLLLFSCLVSILGGLVRR